MFVISGTNDKIWNLSELLSYLSANQNQDIVLKINPEAIDLDNLGVFKFLDMFTFKSVKIHTRNVLENHPRYEIISKWNNPWLEKKANIDLALHTWNLEKTFLCIYRRPTANRLGIASHLYTNHPSQSIVHFAFESDIDNIEFFEFDKLATYNPQCIKNVGNLLAQLPLRHFPGNLDEVKRFVYNYNNNDGLDTYTNIFVDIVSESHVAGSTFYPTEKTARPMWLKKPFITFASKNYLCYLRQMGFRTFGDFWSEDYDGYEGKDRFNQILELVDMLSKKSKNELEQMYLDMQYTLDYNYNLLLNQTYTTDITYIE
jgi:hypothetical protein